MKIGILTFHRSINNGAFMQCYSLSSRLKKDFPDDEIEVIDYNLPSVEKSYSGSLGFYLFSKHDGIKNFAKRVAHLVFDPFQLRRARIKKSIFKNSLSFLPLSRTYFLTDNPEKVIEYINSNIDILVVGSDAIWNFVSRGFPSLYMPDSSIKCLKLSYAASCYGMDFTSFFNNSNRIVTDSLKGLDYIGVRDSATEEFVHFFDKSIEVCHNCDPTCLLDVNNLPVDIEHLKNKMLKRGYDFNKPSIGIMGNPRMLKMIRNFYGHDLQVVSLFNYLKGADAQLYDISPVEWAYIFRFFKFTITTYFHGTYLSLMNNTPVVCIDLGTDFGKKFKPKTFDLLERLGLERWYFKTNYYDLNTKEIKDCCDDFLSNDYSNYIKTRVRKESTYYESFRKALLHAKEKLNNG